MKKLVLLLALFAGFSDLSFAQTATADCSSISVTSNPQYVPNLWGAYVGWKAGNDACNRVIASGNVWQPRYWLEQKQSNGSFTTIGTYQYGNGAFSSLAHGTYRIRIENPILAHNVPGSGCIGTINCYNLSGQYIGQWGIWPSDNGSLMPYSYTNEMVVGATTAAENSFDFVSNGTGNVNWYDFGQTVGINTTASYNYNQWWIAIFENGGQNRWASLGWQNGTIPNPSNYSLTNIWKSYHGSGANFEPYTTYTVQYVVTTQNCSNWNVLNKDFAICPAGTNCRLANMIPEKQPVALHASVNDLHFFNLDFSQQQEYDVNIVGLDGRKVKEGKLFTPLTAIDIQNLQDGMYIANVTCKGQHVFAGKFIK